ncbi:MAG: DUF4399 domain-containing protein [Anaerolineales bacterium]|nr:DUF4399 domain-containing protein [Anaerolineales bacterium]
MIDTPCIDPGEMIPNPPDGDHRHFLIGSTETEIELSPGEHTLFLQAGDGEHTALPGDGMTEVITITVEE